jgi:molybdopterin synthase catalytic subunit
MIEVRVFAQLKQFFRENTRLEVKSGTTAGHLLSELEALKPGAATILQASSIAVAGHLLDRKDLVDDHRRCYVLPPSAAGRMITPCPIRIEEQLAIHGCPQAGAWNIFAGTPRDEILSKSVSYVEYETFEPLAERMIAEIVERVKEKFHLVDASCIHRIGRVPVGEIALLIITASRHRDAAFLGNNHILESVAQQVPIGKQYYREDGSHSSPDQAPFPYSV